MWNLGDMCVSLTGVNYIGNNDRNVIGHKNSDGKIICYVDANNPCMLWRWWKEVEYQRTCFADTNTSLDEI